MLTKRIIPCLDVLNNKVIKGVRFREHVIMGDILDYARFYHDSGADELVFYAINASSSNTVVETEWVTSVARELDIPFCVAGGIRSVAAARVILAAGADKISINSPALEHPELIRELAAEFGSQCVVVGIDSYAENTNYFVYQYTGDANKTRATGIRTDEWAQQAQDLGAGEIVLNCMNQDGVKNGYDVIQLQLIRKNLQIPLIASGGAGSAQDFYTVFKQAQVAGALAASVFHNKSLNITTLKNYLHNNNIVVRR